MRSVQQPMFLMFVATALTGCPAEAPKPPPKAPATRSAAATSRPASAPAAASRPAGATSRPAGAPVAPAGGDQPFSGLVKLGDGAAKADPIQPTDILFIMARQAQGAKAGPLVAVVRHANVSLPLRYEVSAANLMMPGTPFKGPFIVHARLDRDGDPMTRGARDLYGEYASPVGGGAEGIHLVLRPRKAPAGQPASAPAKAPTRRPASAPAKAPASAPAKR